jgi:hypothetical protein
MSCLFIIILFFSYSFNAMEEKKNQDENEKKNKVSLVFKKDNHKLFLRQFFNSNCFLFLSSYKDEKIREKGLMLNSFCKSKEVAKNILKSSIPKDLIKKTIFKEEPFFLKIKNRNLVFLPLNYSFFNSYIKYTLSNYKNIQNSKNVLMNGQEYIIYREEFLRSLYNLIFKIENKENLCFVFSNINNVTLPVKYEFLFRNYENKYFFIKNKIYIFLFDFVKNKFITKDISIGNYHRFKFFSKVEPIIFLNELHALPIEIENKKINYSINISFFDRTDDIFKKKHENDDLIFYKYTGKKIESTPLIEDIGAEDLF